MSIIRISLVVFFLFFSTNSFANERDAFNAVERLFSAMSAFDYQQMKAIGTDDFQLLENGEVWNIDRLITAIKPSGETYQRRNYFAVIKTVTTDNNVWISYWNRADFTYANGNTGSATWLESAVMVKVDNQWKVQMLHSTHLGEKKTLPKHVIMQEYTQ